MVVYVPTSALITYNAVMVATEVHTDGAEANTVLLLDAEADALASKTAAELLAPASFNQLIMVSGA